MACAVAAAHSVRRISGNSAKAATNRPIGSHLKAFGSGRVPICLKSIDEDFPGFPELCYPNRIFSDVWTTILRICYKLWELFTHLLTQMFPFIFSIFSSSTRDTQDFEGTLPRPVSEIEKLDDKHLWAIFSYLDTRTLIKAKATCKRFRKLINSSDNEFAKVPLDQIRLYFDEGEVIIYPIDEKSVPVRYKMPKIQELEDYLRHLTCLSLFIRGLIPIETTPFMKRLTRLQLSPTQIHFLWCEFDVSSEEYFTAFMDRNTLNLTEIGIEACNPSRLISDRLIQHNLSQLTSLRIWNETSNGNAKKFNSITDVTLTHLARIYSSGRSRLEAIDLANCPNCTLTGIVALIEAWYRGCPVEFVRSLTMSIHNCGAAALNGKLERSQIVRQCNAIGIPFNRELYRDRFHLSLYIS
ncbi:hypothetical protein DdX_11042 [Ditylenchus destructor]|uniref:F-box domain-containing protein n=1 Tax=Ditylenchus destructor TaxID=166010 RepID=A0AAD4R4R9_9BILA|nr:hypothetical protein DdX_11042 [Ditylenchus destructor]